MGAAQSTRKITLVNDDKAGVIKLSESLAHRLRGQLEEQQYRQHQRVPEPPAAAAEPEPLPTPILTPPPVDLPPPPPPVLETAKIPSLIPEARHAEAQTQGESPRDENVAPVVSKDAHIDNLEPLDLYPEATPETLPEPSSAEPNLEAISDTPKPLPVDPPLSETTETLTFVETRPEPSPPVAKTPLPSEATVQFIPDKPEVPPSAVEVPPPKSEDVEAVASTVEVVEVETTELSGEIASGIGEVVSDVSTNDAVLLVETVSEVPTSELPEPETLLAAAFTNSDEPITSAAPDIPSEPVIPTATEPLQVPEPISIAPEPVVVQEPEPVVSQTVVEPEPIVESEPIVVPEPILTVAEPVVPVPEPLVVAEPVVVEPVTVAEPAIVEPVAVVEPVITEPVIVAEPVIAEPAIAEPIVVAEPVVVEPIIVTETIVAEPIVVEPTNVAEPVAEAVPEPTPVVASEPEPTLVTAVPEPLVVTPEAPATLDVAAVAADIAAAAVAAPVPAATEVAPEAAPVEADPPVVAAAVTPPDVGTAIQAGAGPTLAAPGGTIPPWSIYAEEAHLMVMRLKAEKDQEIKKLSDEWRAKLDQREIEFVKTSALTEENFNASLKEVESMFVKATCDPVCQNTQEEVMKCYQDHPHQSLRCAREVSQFAQCVDLSRLQAVMKQN